VREDILSARLGTRSALKIAIAPPVGEFRKAQICA
jgi:hypothetical protein